MVQDWQEKEKKDYKVTASKSFQIFILHCIKFWFVNGVNNWPISTSYPCYRHMLNVNICQLNFKRFPISRLVSFVFFLFFSVVVILFVLILTGPINIHMKKYQLLFTERHKLRTRNLYKQKELHLRGKKNFSIFTLHDLHYSSFNLF